MIEYANAGHTPPLVVRSETVDELTETDILLGVVRRAEYVNRTLTLAPGESLSSSPTRGGSGEREGKRSSRRRSPRG